MNLFLISISAENRVPSRTLELIQIVKKHGRFRIFGVDFREKTHGDIYDEYSLEIAEFIVGGPILPGELGCLRSHQMAYQYIVENNISDAVIIEDDALINTSIEELNKILESCRNSKFDLVNLHPDRGGVMIGSRGDNLLRSLVPSLSAFSYWISFNGARRMLSRIEMPLGLADWPVQILKIKSAGTTQNYFAHSGENNSTIKASQNITANTRLSIFYRPFLSFFNIRSLRLTSLLIVKIGFLSTLKAILLMRTYRRLGKLFNKSILSDNSTVKIYL